MVEKMPAILVEYNPLRPLRSLREITLLRAELAEYAEIKSKSNEKAKQKSEPQQKDDLEPGFNPVESESRRYQNKRQFLRYFMLDTKRPYLS